MNSIIVMMSSRFFNWHDKTQPLNTPTDGDIRWDWVGSRTRLAGVGLVRNLHWPDLTILIRCSLRESCQFIQGAPQKSGTKYWVGAHTEVNPRARDKYEVSNESCWPGASDWLEKPGKKSRVHFGISPDPIFRATFWRGTLYEQKCTSYTAGPG